MVGDIDIKRSTTAYVFTVGGTSVSWISKLQKVVALSIAKVEYVAATEASKEMIWLQSLLEETGYDTKVELQISNLVIDQGNKPYEEALST